MSRLGTFKRRTLHISRSLIQQHIKDSDTEDDADQDTDSGGSLIIKSSHYEKDCKIPKCVSAENLLSCKAWLGQLCEHEQTLESDSNWSTPCDPGSLSSAIEEHGCHYNSAIERPSMDVEVLNRIRDGRGPRDQVFDDVLAPLRGSSPRGHSAETYDELQKVLLAWNERILGNLGKEQDARKMLKTAIEKRASLLERMSHGGEEKQALDDASAKLLHALTTLRPEIASFKDHDHFEVLVMMWAHVGIAIPDMDDDLKLLALEALLNELESRSRMTNAEKLSEIAQSLSVTRSKVDMAEIERLEAKTQMSEEKMRETMVRKLIDKVKLARRELVQVKLKELLELTTLQAAQNWAAHDKVSKTRCWHDQHRTCGQADGKLQRALRQQMPELDAHVQVAQSNAKVLTDMGASLLSRALKAKSSTKDESTSTLTGLEGSDFKTYLTESMTNILHARGQAAKMVDQMDTVGHHLDVLLSAAKNQYREYDRLSCLLYPAASLGTDGDTEVEFAEKFGPRRESILLMARGMQRARDS
ncbi:hypothetical protein EKO04_006485 [Ascochyta lentis]|uniref:Uncharacterized protein n=1 Tax=Ascochyta lentis TaxID=205686 RepID=A0A8H7J1I7_9PLEO|nr:hypothetical protein EKO04_006485 [Ascochyta lentis]